MAIDPKLVSIKTASELPTGNPTNAGQFFFFEGNQMKKAPMTDIYDKVNIGIKGVATQTNAPTAYTAEEYPNGLFERYVVSAPLTAPNSWGDIAVTQAELDDNFVFFNVTNGVVVKELSKKPEVILSTVVNPTSTNKATTGEAVYDFVKKEVATTNLFNKNTFKSGFTFNTITGVEMISNEVNGISDFIKVDSNSYYSLIEYYNRVNKNFNQTNDITAIFLVEYDDSLGLIGYKNIFGINQIKTSSTTAYVKINPNSNNGFENWINNIVFAKVSEMQFSYVGYNETEQTYNEPLTFYKKTEPISRQNYADVSVSNNTIIFHAGKNNLKEKIIFDFLYDIEFGGNARMVFKLTGNNIENVLPFILDYTNNVFNQTKGNNKSLQPNLYFRKGEVNGEYFIIADGYFDSFDYVSFLKVGNANFELETEVQLNVECYILYLDDNGKPRNLDGISIEQLNTLSQQVQNLSNSIPQSIAEQAPDIIQQQIGSGLNNYIAQHINDFTFSQPNYIQANSGFNFTNLNSTMNGKFISVIQDIDLQGATIDFIAQGVKNLKIVFNGGRILNGKIKSNYTRCIFNSNEAFVNVEILNQFQNDYALPEWFGAKIDGQDGGIGDFTYDDSFAMNQALKFSSTVRLTGNRTMIVKKPIVLRSGNSIKSDKNFVTKLGDASNCTLLKNEHIDIPNNGIGDVTYPQNFVRNKNISVDGGIWDGNGLKQNRNNSAVFGDQADVIGTQDFLDGDGIDYIGFMMKFADIDNFELKNFVIRNPRTYGIALGGISNYRISNIEHIRTYHIENGDGIHLHGKMYNGVIDNIFGQSGDDLVAVTTEEAGRLSMRTGDVIGLRIRNIFNYGEPEGTTIQNPKEITDGNIAITRSTRPIRISYTASIIDDVIIENVRGLRGKFIPEIIATFVPHPEFTTKGKIGSLTVENVKNKDGCSALSVGPQTTVDVITLRNVYMKWQSTEEYPAILKMTDHLPGFENTYEQTVIGTVVIDNCYYEKGTSLYDAKNGLIWMAGKIKNLFLNNIIVETKAGASKIDSLLSGRIEYCQITNSKMDIKNIVSTNGQGVADMTLKEVGNEWNNTNIGIVTKRAITDSIVLPTNPTNPKMGDKILKSDGIYLFTNAWNKL